MMSSLRPFVRYFLWLLTALIILIGMLLTFFWYQNNAIAHPLPFGDDNTNTFIASDINSDSKNEELTLNIIASPTLKSPLEAVLAKFTAQYTNVSPSISYIDENKMMTYIETHPEIQLVLADAQVINNIKQQNIANDDNSSQDTDATNQTLNANTEQQLATFTFAYKKPKTHASKTVLDVHNNAQSDKDDNADNSYNTDIAHNHVTKELMIQGYAINEPSRDNRQDSALISFRQFILASNIQKLIDSNEISSIESYKNNVADLFNPNGRSSSKNGKTEASEVSIFSDSDSDADK